MRNFIYLLVVLSSFLLSGYADLLAQPAKKEAVSTKSDIKEIETYQKAMSWFQKGEAMIGTESENSDEQMEMFRKAIETYPEFLEAHYNLGLIYINRKKMKEASAEFETVLRIEADFDPDIYYLLGMTHSEAGNTREALAAIEKGLQRKPDDMAMLKILGYLQLQTNQNDAAADTLRRIASADPTDAEARANLALLYYKKDEIEKAVAMYNEALNIDSKNFAARYNLGLIYVRQQKMAEAVEEFEKARVIEPENVELLERIGDTRTYLNQYAHAADVYQEAIKKGGDAKNLLPKLGLSLANVGRIPAAIETLEKAAALDAKNPNTWFLLGDLYSDTVKPEEAIAAYRKSLELRPDQKEIHLNLGVLYAEKEMYAEAMTELRQAAALDTNYVFAWRNIAQVAEKLADDKEAISAHEKLISLGGGAAYNHFNLGILYARNNQPDKSIDAFAKAIEMEPVKYREILKEELKSVHSALDPIRFQKRFTDLLTP